MNSPFPAARSSEKYPVGWNIRSRRTRSRATRDDVTIATAPLANSTRAFGQVEVGRHDRQARGADVDHVGAAGQVQHQVEVVNHEIEHHRHVAPAELERREPGALEVADVVEMFLRRAESPG
jgi:hypothetical protein